MEVKSWERRENSNGKCTVYVRFVPRKPAPKCTVYVRFVPRKPAPILSVKEVS